MGIPRLKPWLMGTFPDAFDQMAGIEADHVYIDMNAVLHEVLEGIGGSPSEGEFFSGLCFRLDQILQQVEARVSVFFAVDGAAACAKVSTQRQRRRAKSTSVRSQRKGQKRAINSDGPSFTANMLTPGVPAMSRVSACLEEYCKTRLSSSGEDLSWAEGLRVTVSGASCHGEGEHKIMSAVRTNSVGPDDTSHVIFGNDSDLLLLPLGLTLDPGSIFVAWRNPGRRVTDTTGRSVPALMLCDARAVSHALRVQLAISGDAQVADVSVDTIVRTPIPADEISLRRDFIFVTLLRGNDYLPPLQSEHDATVLWERYLRWRRASSPSMGLVGIAEAGSDIRERIVLHRDVLADFMRCQSGALPSMSESLRPAVAQYLQGLLWCLSTYTGVCPDEHYRFPRVLDKVASAVVLAEHLPSLTADDLTVVHTDTTPLHALTCALAVLPVTDVRSFLLPTAPSLEPLLDTHGILGGVALLEGCQQCAQLSQAVERHGAASKKADRARRLLEAHRRSHTDIEDVCLVKLDAEVRRLCREAADVASLVQCLSGAGMMVLSPNSSAFELPVSASGANAHDKKRMSSPCETVGTAERSTAKFPSEGTHALAQAPKRRRGAIELHDA